MAACQSFKTTSLSKRSYEFKYKPPKENIEIFADPLEIELSLVNLFRNSVQAQREGTKSIISIEVKKTENFCDILVEDNGPTLTSSQLASFEETQTSSNSPQGLGLGISIVRFLVENYGGTVDFSRSELGGLKVRISLPLSSGTKDEQIPKGL